MGLGREGPGLRYIWICDADLSVVVTNEYSQPVEENELAHTMFVVFTEFAANAVLGQLIIDLRNCLVLKPLSDHRAAAHRLV